ncbi:MAG TPA: neutral zinc metallopeptidase, partial [Steroidobacteraceae bacterium]|nr:neutral zinc metallopeptidase [Steroidobacteraceae bacterium]
MDIRGGRRSTNVEDRRGMRIGRTGAGIGIGGVAIAIVLSLLGINPLPFLEMTQQGSQVEMQPGDQPYQESPREAQYRELAEVVLGETETTWGQQFGGQYTPARLVLYTEATQSECGTGQAAMGPFYCPLDQRVYVDLSFFDDMQSRFRAGGDFAYAYVIAHEVGHHVQHQLGITQKVEQVRARGNAAQTNNMSVRLELQADCFAGVWGHHAQNARQILEQGDVEEALNAAAQIGDDRMQMRGRGYVAPESFTHGSG